MDIPYLLNVKCQRKMFGKMPVSKVLQGLICYILGNLQQLDAWILPFQTLLIPEQSILWTNTKD